MSLHTPGLMPLAACLSAVTEQEYVMAGDESVMRDVIARNNHHAGWDRRTNLDIARYFGRSRGLSAQHRLDWAHRTLVDVMTMPGDGSPGYLQLNHMLALACVKPPH